jgi:hypothetical protein
MPGRAKVRVMPYTRPAAVVLELDSPPLRPRILIQCGHSGAIQQDNGSIAFGELKTI